MKNYFISLTLIFGLFTLSSFASKEVAPDVDKIPKVTQTVVPYSFSGFNPCTAEPEFIEVFGTLTIIVKEQVDGNGGSHYTVNMKYRAEGVGVPSGIRYKLIAAQQFSGYAGESEMPYTETFHIRFKMVTQGGASNPRQHIVGKFTVNKNGSVTVDFERLYRTCG